MQVVLTIHKKHVLSILSICILIYTNVFASKILVGPTRQYKSPSAVSGLVKDNDTVEIDSGIYTNESTTWNANNLTLRGKVRGVHLVAPSSIPNQKAIWVIAGDQTLIENIEFSGASVPDKNGAGIRLEKGSMIIRNCSFHDNEDGILGGSGPSCQVVIENSEFYNNGFGDGYSHNIYIGNAASFLIQYCYTHGAKIGHLIKTRAQKNLILYNRIMDEGAGTASYEIDIPNGGTSHIIGNIIHQGAKTANPTIITYGEEGLSNTEKDLYVMNNTIVNDLGSGTFIRVAASAPAAKVGNNLFVGLGTMVNGLADTSKNIVTSVPNLVGQKTFDYRPTAITPGINRGGTYGTEGGFALAPAFQYVYDLGTEPRKSVGTMDIGAFEYDSTKVNALRYGNRPKIKGIKKVDVKLRSVKGQIVTDQKIKSKGVVRPVYTKNP